MKIETIKALMIEVPVFDLLDADQREIIAEYVKYRFIEKDKAVFTEGTAGNSLYYILSG